MAERLVADADELVVEELALAERGTVGVDEVETLVLGGVDEQDVVAIAEEEAMGIGGGEDASTVDGAEHDIGDEAREGATLGDAYLATRGLELGLGVAAATDEEFLLGTLVAATGGRGCLIAAKGFGLLEALVLDCDMGVEGVGVEVGVDDAPHGGVVESGVLLLDLMGEAAKALADDVVVDGVEIFLYVALGHIEGVATMAGTVVA